ncbi:MAG: PKD domain-containing protein [Myxococcaceae bacterium]|nr:PKD domain-containing protein [Myxococcaceae bacterium]
MQRNLLVVLLAAAGCSVPGTGDVGAEPVAARRHDALGTPADAVVDVTLGGLTLNNPSRRDFWSPAQVAVDPRPPHAVYVADHNNYRLLSWSTLAAFFAQQPAEVEQTDSFFNVSSVCVSPVDGRIIRVTQESSCDGTCFYSWSIEARSSPFFADAGPTQYLSSSSRDADSVRFALDFDSQGRVFVAENHRVSRYASWSALAGSNPTPEAVVGQANVNHARPNRVDARGLEAPRGVALDTSVTPNRLYVADTTNNRVLVWLDATAAGAGRPADLVVGQPDFEERACATTATERERTLCQPGSLAVDATGRLFVADNGFCRVVAFTRPTANGPPVAQVWGQPNATTVGCTYSPGPSSVAFRTDFYWGGTVAVNARGDLFVGDDYFRRVLQFPSQGPAPAWPATVASQVFGPSTFNSFGPCIAASVCAPRGLAASDSALYVSDSFRVLEYPSFPDGGYSTAPSLVLGQSSVGAGNMFSPTLAANTVEPFGLALSASGSLAVASRKRVLVFTPPFSNNKPATTVLGQPDFVSEPNAFSPRAVGFSSAGHVFTAELEANRVVWYPAPQAATGTAPSTAVYGQPNLTSTGPNFIEAGGMNTPRGLVVDRSVTPNRLFVVDSRNRRVLGWNSTSFTTGQVADVVFGQPDFVTVTPRPTTPGMTGLSEGTSFVAVGAGLVLVSDAQFNRVLGYRPTGGPPVAVFGQSSFTSSDFDAGWVDQTQGTQLASTSTGLALAPQSGANRVLALHWDGGSRINAVFNPGQDRPDLVAPNRTKPTGFHGPLATAIDRSVTPNRLYVADSNNNRVLVWNNVRALQNGTPPDAVLGQPTMADHQPGTSAARFRVPTAVAVDSTGRVAVNDQGNHRVLIFNAPFAPGGDLVADAVLGQTSFTDNRPNRDGGLSADTLWQPTTLTFTPRGSLVVGDSGNLRLMWFDPPFFTGKAATAQFGQASFTSAASNGCTASTNSTVCQPYGLAAQRLVDGGTSLYYAERGAGFITRFLRFDEPLPNDLVPDLLLTGNTLPQSRFDFDSFGNMFWSNTFTLFRCPAGGSTCASFASGSNRYGPGAFDDDGSLYMANGNQVTVLFGDSAPLALDAGITPSPARTNDTLVGFYRYTDADNEPETGTTYRWLKNGVEQPGLSGTTVAPALTTRGDTWVFEVTPRDGRRVGNPALSPALTILNTAPLALDAGITPAVAVTTNDLELVYGFSDVDADLPGPPRVRWELDSPSGFIAQARFNDSLTISAAETQKGQRWRARLQAFDGVTDGTGYGPEVVTEPREILNSAPLANAGPDQALAPTGPLTAVTVDGTASSDADADNLTYTWTEGAMTLGTSSRLTVQLAEGLHTLRLECFDGTARSTDEVLIDISSVSPDAGVLTGSGDVAPGWVALRGVAEDPLSRPLRFQWSQTSGPMALLQDATQPTARAFAVERGARTWRFQATAGATPAVPRDVTLTTTNLGPWPGWLPRLVVLPQTALPVRPRAADDSNADPLTHSWSTEAGQLRTSAGGAEATITAARPGVFTVTHDVDDGQGGTATAISELVVVGASPDVFLRVPASVAASLGMPVTLDASRSFTLDGRPLSFQWQLVSGRGTLASSRSAQAAFTPDSTGPATLRVTATTAEGGTQSKDVTVVVNVPTAVATRPAPAKVTDTVTLDASRSFDAQGSTLTFAWRQVGGPPVVLSNAMTARASFTALRPGLLRFEVTASNAAVSSLPVPVDVVVTTGLNQPPTANAGADQQATVGAEVTLASTASSDPNTGDVLRPRWEQLSGPPVPLHAEAQVVRFTPTVAGRYRFELVVWDAEVPSEPDVVEVVVARANNQAPVAVIDAPERGEPAQPLALSGARSSDADGDALTYRWTVTGAPSGATATLTQDTTSSATLTADTAGLYTVRLVVSDGSLVSPPAEATLVVGMPSVKGCGCSGGLGAPAALATLLALGLVRRRRAP